MYESAHLQLISKGICSSSTHTVAHNLHIFRIFDKARATTCINFMIFFVTLRN